MKSQPESRKPSVEAGISGGADFWAHTELGGITTSLRFRREAVIFREGDRCTVVHVLSNGRVKLFATSRTGRTLFLKIARAGQLLGLSAALSNSPYEVTAQAVESCELRGIPRQFFIEFLRRNPAASLLACHSVCRDYLAAFSEARRIAFSARATGRLATLLIEWTRDQSHGSDFAREPFKVLTHDDIAAMAATTRETVTRVFSQMKRDKTHQDRGNIAHNPEAAGA